MPGEAYVQYILNQLNGVEVHGSENMQRMLNAIRYLERLRDDIVTHAEAKNERRKASSKNDVGKKP